MKRIAFIGAVAAVICAAQPASAFELTGGEANLAYWQQDDGQWRFGHINGSVAANIAGAFGAMVNVSSSGYADSETTIRSAELHLTYKVSEPLTIGAFYAHDQLGRPFEYAEAGIELAYEADRFSVEAAILSHGFNEDWANTGYVLSGTYHVSDRLDVLGSVASLPVQNNALVQVGLGYEVADNLVLSGMVARNVEWDLNFVGINLGYKFGNGVPFKGRSYYQRFPVQD